MARDASPALSRASDAEWREVGSELEALLREAALIHELQPIVNVQTGAPDFKTRDVPGALVRDVLVIVPSIEEDSAELVGARADGGWMIQRTRRNGADLAVHTQRLRKFFAGRLSARKRSTSVAPCADRVFVAGRPRRDGDAARSARRAIGARASRARCRAAAIDRFDERLFTERLVIYS